MEDLLQPDFYSPNDAPEIAHRLAKMGLFNVGQLIAGLYQQISEQEERIEELEDEVSGSEYAAEEAREDAKYRAKEFANWFLNEFEDEKIKVKRIGDVEFHIIRGSDYQELKDIFHRELD